METFECNTGFNRWIWNKFKWEISLLSRKILNSLHRLVTFALVLKKHITATVLPEIIHTSGKFWLKVTSFQPTSFFLRGRDTGAGQKVTKWCTIGAIVKEKEQKKQPSNTFLPLENVQSLPRVWIILGNTVFTVLCSASALVIFLR